MPNNRPFALGAQDHLRSRIRQHSSLLQQIRAFFYAHDVLEVDTPILSQAATPDEHLYSLACPVQVPGESQPLTYYLHTSPEYPMKRLLCEGSGDIFYLGKVFRDADASPRHQIEFTMLEWYRLNFTWDELVQEVVSLLQGALGQKARLAVETLSYQQAFQKYAGIENIHQASAETCRDCLQQRGVADIIGVDADDKVLWEQLVLTEVIEPQLGQEAITVLHHFPARDAALAMIDSDNTDWALRFEVYVQGMELANGYQELMDAELYRKRFESSLTQREQMDLPQMPVDERLLASLAKEGLPACSGVALGVDRLFMLQQGFTDIQQAIPFDYQQA